MPMTDDEIGVETEIAALLDEMAGELNGLAEQLRRKPFAAIEVQLQKQYFLFDFLLATGQFVMAGDLDSARIRLRQINDGTVEAFQQAARRMTQQLEQRRKQHSRPGVAETTTEA